MNKKPLLITFISLTLSGCQSPPRHGNRPPMSPIFEVLDANHDGVIDADEIANAPAALWKLEKNHNGQLDYEEVRPVGRDLPGEPPPLVNALDVNHDDVIDSNEIANAAAALKVLDKNADGQLSLSEVLPPPPIAPRPPFGERPSGGRSPGGAPPPR